jgi:hypothetical protein
MPNFKCSKCGCLENTATSHYFSRKRGAPPLCSECDPRIGRWHGRFAKQSCEGLNLASDGFLYDPKEDLKWRMENQGLKIIGPA